MITRAVGGEIVSITPSWEMGMELREIVFHHLGEFNNGLLNDLEQYVKVVYAMGFENGRRGETNNGGTT